MAFTFRKFVATVFATLVVFTASTTTLQKQNQDENHSEDRGLSPTNPDVYELSQGGMLCTYPNQTCTESTTCCQHSTCKTATSLKCECDYDYKPCTGATLGCCQMSNAQTLPPLLPSRPMTLSMSPTGVPSGVLSGPAPSSKPSCENSIGYLYEEVEEHSCEWAADKPKKRCKKKDSTRENQKLSVFCPFECDLRCGCRNHKKPFSFEGKKKRCKSVNESDCMKEAGRGGKKIVADFCPKKCNTCYSR